MNKVVRKILIIAIILISIPFINVNAERYTDNVQILIQPSKNKIEANEDLNVRLSIENVETPVSIVSVEMYYSKNIFEEAVEEDFDKVGRWAYPTVSLYEEDDTYYYYKITTERSNDVTTIGEITNFSLKVREEVENFDGACLGISYIEMANKDATEIIKEVKNVEFNFKNNVGIYLDTDIYHIGDKNQTTYRAGDEYITRILPNTTREQFVKNLYTNGDITLYDVDGTEQEDNDVNDNEIIKTGMRIKVSPKAEEEEIEEDEETEDIDLTLIVMGDIDKSGNVTSTDLAELKQGIQKEIVLEGAPYKAADISEDDKLSAADLATMIQLILQELVV